MKPVNELTDDEVNAAMNQMPPNARTFYFHAFQSKMFNHQASLLAERKQLEKGDLVQYYDNLVEITEENLKEFKLSDLVLPLIGFQTL